MLFGWPNPGGRVGSTAFGRYRPNTVYPVTYRLKAHRNYFEAPWGCLENGYKFRCEEGSVENRDSL